MSELDLLVIGDCNPDLVVSGGDVHPRFGQVESIVDAAELVIGGSATITAVGAARLGITAGLCAVVGDDRLGKVILSMVELEGVDTAAVRTHPTSPTGITVVLVDDRDRAMLTSPGTISALTLDDLEGLPDSPARHIHVSSYYLMSRAFRSGVVPHLRRFSEAGCSVSVDTNWDPSEDWDVSDLLDVVDVFLPNEKELLAITASSSIEAGLPILRHSSGADVVVKTGRAGAAALLDGELVRIPAPEVSGFVDAIGAGDSFNAGYIAARLAGLGPFDAVELGVSVGSLSTRGAGGTASQPSREEAWLLAGVVR